MPKLRKISLWAAIATALFVGLWFGSVALLSDSALVNRIGWPVLYVIGLAWMVYGVERVARKIETKSANKTLGPPQVTVGGEVASGRRRGWNPLDPAARYYGRTGQRLRQTFALLGAYSLLFTAMYYLAHMTFGNKAQANEYDLPAGGGTDSPKASSVKVQKVIQKKYVINPYSSIMFAAPPPIENIDVKLTEETSNRYQVGQGDGGLGSGEDEGGGFGSGKGGGKIRFIRLRHSDKTWDKNFGVGGDRNLLAELLARYPRMLGKVADETEAIDAATLGTFPATKSPPLLYIGAVHTFAPTATDKRVLKQYLTERHGMILGDNLGGSGFHGSFLAAMNEITGVAPVPISRDDPIHKRPFELPLLPIVVAHGGSTALGWKIDGRWAVYYHPGALSDAWRDDHAGIKKDVWDMCYQLGINIISYAHREQDQWRRSQQP